MVQQQWIFSLKYYHKKSEPINITMITNDNIFQQIGGSWESDIDTRESDRTELGQQHPRTE